MAGTFSSNPVVQSITSGNAPKSARSAAARGLLPLAQADLLEALVYLSADNDPGIASAAQETLASQQPNELLDVARTDTAAPTVLGYFASLTNAAPELHEAVVTNVATPDEAIVLLAQASSNASLLELITINQQRLIRAPAIIDAVLVNPARTAEAERRAKEIRREFFEKERGARQIAQELRARGNEAAAEFFETAELSTVDGEMSIDDAWFIAQHIEVSDVDIDDSWLAREYIAEMMVESPEKMAANVQAVINAERLEGDVSPERISMIRRIMFMTVKDRVKLAMKGDREARGILIRDSNKIVATGVIHNPRITDQEIEGISAMRQISDEVLRLIGNNRAWARSYSIIHNLARNPRTPMATAVQILPRIRSKDLKAISLNRNVSEAVRRQAYRLSEMRGPGG
ncbi:MAG TPA: hypothetical protein VE969_09575 [Pyrinomonadaceae bacterium]|jgi:regulator of extracellular matrix RemA (YlzA/DUF370 family)|nr:hypothetical protein [Pyrinomonadaceae bacterium]